MSRRRKCVGVAVAWHPLLLTIALVVLSATACLARADDMGDIVGTYVGRVANDGRMDEVVVVFEVAPDGGYRGHYVVRERDAHLDGKLDELWYDGAGKLTGYWFDAYGTGRFELEFSADFGSFEGWWGTDEEPPTLPWSGVRKR